LTSLAKDVIAIAGNPNSGKTTAFNRYTGARQHVGNYPGITVEKKDGVAHIDGKEVTLVDLPGTYSLTAYSME
jgi:ferrous iron transport protein B